MLLKRHSDRALNMGSDGVVVAMNGRVRGLARLYSTRKRSRSEFTFSQIFTDYDVIMVLFSRDLLSVT